MGTHKNCLIYVISVSTSIILWRNKKNNVNPGPAEPGYALPLQTVLIQISWLLKPTDLDLHCLAFYIWIFINNLRQANWLADNWK